MTSYEGRLKWCRLRVAALEYLDCLTGVECPSGDEKEIGWFNNEASSGGDEGLMSTPSISAFLSTTSPGTRIGSIAAAKASILGFLDDEDAFDGLEVGVVENER